MSEVLVVVEEKGGDIHHPVMTDDSYELFCKHEDKDLFTVEIGIEYDQYGFVTESARVTMTKEELYQYFGIVQL